MKGERRLGALVGVQIVFAQTVAAATGREVVERAVEPVPAEEPVEGALGTGTVLGLARDPERSQLGLDERGCVERLLVAEPRRRLVAMPPLWPGSRSMSSASPHSSPSQASDSSPSDTSVSRPRAVPPTIKRVREARVVVAEVVLEPPPAVGARSRRAPPRAG